MLFGGINFITLLLFSVGGESNLSEFWDLNPSIVFLNHGSFGACPKVVFENYQFWQSELEKQPVNFFTKILYPELEKSRRSVANFLGCDQNELILVCI